MYKRFVENFIYWLSALFLVGSIYIYVAKIAKFKWQGLFGTDALTLYGEVVALLLMLVNKIPIIKRVIAWALLMLNFWQIDYEVTVIMIAPDNFAIAKLRECFDKAVESCGLYKHHDYKVNRDTKVSYEIFHRAMAANVILRKIPVDQDAWDSDEQELTQWKVEVNGVSTYRILSKNVKFIINNFLESAYREHVSVKKLFLSISNKHTEYSLADKGILINPRKYRISNSQVSIDYNKTTAIIIDSNKGLQLTSLDRGDFANAFGSIKQILIN